MTEKGRIVVLVLPPGGKPVLVLDRETGRLLLYTITYNKHIGPGLYDTPEKIVDLFKVIATRGHIPKNEDYNPMLVYKLLEALLLSDAPMKVKLEQVMKYVRTAIK